MNGKLTLSLNKESIRKGKHFAKRNRKSVSALVQDYFDSLDKSKQPFEEKTTVHSPLTHQMVKMIRAAKSKSKKPEDDRPYNEILTGEILKKYKASEKDLSRFKRAH